MIPDWLWCSFHFFFFDKQLFNAGSFIHFLGDLLISEHNFSLKASNFIEMLLDWQSLIRLILI